MSSYSFPYENNFQLNKLLVNEYTDKKTYKKYIEKNYEEEYLNSKRNMSDTFGLCLMKIQKESKKKTLFNPNSLIEPEDKRQFFGAFAKNLEMTNKCYEENRVKCSIPKLENNISFQAESFNNDNELNEYLNDYSLISNKVSKICNNSANTSTKVHYLNIFENINLLEKHFSQIKKIPEMILENHFKNIDNSQILEETLLFNPFKIINYDICLQNSYSNLVYSLSSPTDTNILYPLIIYLIQGIPSDLFVFNCNPNVLAFEVSDSNFRFLSCIPKFSQEMLSYFIMFGTKMYLIGVLIDFYLYNNEKASYIIKKFYSQISLIIIKINESIIKIRNEFTNNNYNIVGLLYKIQNYSGIINMIFHLVNLPEATQKYSESSNLISNTKYNIFDFITFYENCSFNLKSHRLLDSLFSFFYSFNHIKSKNYKIIKNTLLIILKSYLQFIVYLIFDSEIIDKSGEYFIIKTNGNNNFAIDNSKVPLFLSDYKNILVNNIVLSKMLKKYDNKFFSVINYKINETIYFIEKLNFNENSDNLEQIHSFIEFKDKIFGKKIELMYTVNESILAELKLKQNEEKIKKINNLRILKEFMSIKDEYNRKEKEKEIETKKKLLQEIQKQILERKQKIDDDIRRINEERIEEMNRQREYEKIRQEIIIKLKEKYNSIIENTNEIEKYRTDNKMEIWKNKRSQNNVKSNLQNLLLNDMSDNAITKNQDDNFDKTQTIEKYDNSPVDNISNHVNEEVAPLKNFEEDVKMGEIENNIIEEKVIHENSSSTFQVDSEVNEILNKMKVIIEETENNQKRNIEIPISVILNEFFYDLIIKQYRITNNAFTLLLKNKFGLSSHFEFIRKLYLGGDGDTLLHVIENCIDYRTLTLVSNEEQFLNDIFKSELKKKGTNYDYLNIKKLSTFNLKYSIHNLESAFKVEYILPEPVNFVFQNKIMDGYDEIFKTIFKYNIFINISAKIFALFKNNKKSGDPYFGKISKIIFKSTNLIKSFLSFFFNEILHNKWNEMIQNIEDTTEIYSIVNEQINYQSKIQEVLKDKFFFLINKILKKIAKIYMKTVIGETDYVDIEGLKADEKFIKTIEKISSSCDNFRLLLENEYVIGDFHNLKYYVN